MNKSVERSIALWKEQNGPIRNKIGRHLQADFLVLAELGKHHFFIGYAPASVAGPGQP